MAFYNGSIPYIASQNIVTARQNLINMATTAGLSWASAASTNINNNAWWINKAATSPVATYNYTYNAGNAVRQQIGVLLTNSSALIGVKVSSQTAADWGAVIGALGTWNQQKYYPLFSMGWMPDFNDPDDYVHPLLMPNPSDMAHVNDAHINASIAASLSATTTAGRQAAYNDLMNYTQNGLYPWIFLHQGHLREVWTDNVLGYSMNIMNQPYFYDVYFSSSSTTPGGTPGSSSVPGYDVAILGVAVITASIIAVLIVRKKSRL
jgi:ABC-type oligopeptide transport system substrate-binding subunit